MTKTFISSEEYRQMLVKDGERRFQEWQTQYLNYRKHYLRDMAQLQEENRKRAASIKQK